MTQVPSDSIRVLLVDDNPELRAALVPLIDSWSGWTVVAALASADDLVPAVVRERPHIVLLDIDMPGRDPIHAIEDLCYRQDPARVLVLSALGDKRTVHASLEAGASGYVLKIDGAEALRTGLSEVAAGRTYLSPGLAALHPLERG